MDEQYALTKAADPVPTAITVGDIKDLASITADFSYVATTEAASGKNAFKLCAFNYTEGGTTIYLDDNGGWTSDINQAKTGGDGTVPATTTTTTTSE